MRASLQGNRQSANPNGALIHAHPERWSRQLGCVICMTLEGELRHHAHELWCVHHLDAAKGHIARIASEARGVRKNLRLPDDVYKRRRGEAARAIKNLREIVGERDDWTCAWCGVPATHIDHIKPVRFGGLDDLDNLAIVCGECNSSKGDRPFPSWIGQRIQDAAWLNSGGIIIVEDWSTS